MKIAHVLLVHKNPNQIRRLISRLSFPDIDCFIHIDKKHDSIHFQELKSFQNTSIIQPNIKVDWGCYNTVDAMLLAIDRVLNAAKKYDYINFMSGQDYPLQHPNFFQKYLIAHDGFEFIGNRPMEESKQNIDRFVKYHFKKSIVRGAFFERAINKVSPARKFPYPYEVRKGPQWMTLTRNAALYISDFVSKNPRYVNYFKKVHIPDEFFFQTLLYNSPFQQKMKNQIFHYIDWSEMKKNPKTLTWNDFDKLNASNLFFARKFDEAFDSSILDAIDKKISNTSVW